MSRLMHEYKICTLLYFSISKSFRRFFSGTNAKNAHFCIFNQIMMFLVEYNSVAKGNVKLFKLVTSNWHVGHQQINLSFKLASFNCFYMAL